MNAPVATIVLPTHNREHLLSACLESLVADGSVTAREIVVVDNASSDGTAALVQSIAERTTSVPIRYVFEPKLGASNARNAGISRSQGEFIVFVDDDVRVDDGWLDQMLVPFTDPAIGLVAGRVVADWPPDPPRWARACGHYIAPWDPGDDPASEPKRVPVVTASLAVRREALDALGPEVFDPRLGPRGTTTFNYEETALLRRLSPPWSVHFATAAVSHHPVPAQRFDRRYLMWSSLQAGVGAARADVDAHEWNLSVVQRTARFAYTASTALGRRCVRSLRDDPAWVRRELQAFHWSGRRLEYLLGPRYPRLVDRIAARSWRTARS